MKLNVKNMMVFGAVALTALSCAKTPEFVKAEKGPEMEVLSSTGSTYMGAEISVDLKLADADFALSTVKAFLYYGETEVATATLRTKNEGEYKLKLRAPLLKDVPDGTASLVLKAQNVGLGITEKTLDVALTRPNFEELTLVDEDGKEYKMKKTADYSYELTDDFPAYVNANLVTPSFRPKTGTGEEAAEEEVITLGWDGSVLTAADGSELIPFGASIAGRYTLKANLSDLSVSPTGSAAVVSVAKYSQGQKMDFGNVVNVEAWTLDPDFFDVDKETKAVTFRAIDGLYRMTYDTENLFVKVEPMKDENKVLTLSEDGSGAVWAIGANFGKPVIGPGWNTEDGAYPAAQVSDKVYEFTLAVPGQLAISGGEFKFFHQKGWGGEFVRADFAEVKLDPAFQMTDGGNIQAADVTAGKGYRIVLDLTAGVKAAKISYKEVEVTVAGLNITVNGEKALKMSADVYKVTAVKVEKGSTITFSGIDNPQEWMFDKDHFELTAEGLKFNAITAWYSFELNVKDKYVIVRHVKSDGKAATYAGEKAITFMGWGVGYPTMASQLGWDSGLLITLAQIEDGVYQFTGVACKEGDETMVGNCWCYNTEITSSNFLSFKFFGQAGWGDEMRNVTLTEEAKKYLSFDGNVELIVDHKENAVIDGNEEERKVFKPLELGATYRMTVTNCSALDGGKFDVTIDFRKM